MSKPNSNSKLEGYMFKLYWGRQFHKFLVMVKHIANVKENSINLPEIV